MGVVFVTATRKPVCTTGMSYTPAAIRLVSVGRDPPIRG